MTVTAPSPIVSRPNPVRPTSRGSVFLDLLRTTDHKTIGKMYLVTSFAFFLAGGIMALLIRGELARPGLQYLSQEQYNQLFTMHGTIMLLFFATPMVFAFANLVLPLQIGAPDVSLPAAQRVVLLAVPVRRPDGDARLPRPRRGGRLRVVRLRAAHRRHQLARHRAPTCGSSGSPSAVWAPSSAAST